MNYFKILTNNVINYVVGEGTTNKVNSVTIQLKAQERDDTIGLTTIFRYVYSCLKNRKQCVKINNTYSDPLDILSRVPQGFIVGPILFNIFLNDFFYVILISSPHNYADDST